MNSEIKRRDALKAIFGGSLLAMAGVSTAGNPAGEEDLLMSRMRDLDCNHPVVGAMAPVLRANILGGGIIVVAVDLPGGQIVSTEEVIRELRRSADK